VPDNEHIQFSSAVRLADTPALPRSVEVGAPTSLLRVETLEGICGWRAVRGEAGMDVRGSRLDNAVFARREKMQVSAHEAVVVSAAAAELGRDTDNVPITGELCVLVWVEPETPSPHLAHRDIGGDLGHIHQYVQLRTIPTFPKEPAGSNEQPDLACGEQPGSPGRPAAGGELAAFVREDGNAVLSLRVETSDRERYPLVGSKLR